MIFSIKQFLVVAIVFMECLNSGFIPDASAGLTSSEKKVALQALRIAHAVQHDCDFSLPELAQEWTQIGDTLPQIRSFFDFKKSVAHLIRLDRNKLIGLQKALLRGCAASQRSLDPVSAETNPTVFSAHLEHLLIRLDEAHRLISNVPDQQMLSLHAVLIDEYDERKRAILKTVFLYIESALSSPDMDWKSDSYWKRAFPPSELKRETEHLLKSFDPENTLGLSIESAHSSSPCVIQ
jgi:hypothetical protein